MYSMILDSVRDKNEKNQIMAEVLLMRAALQGNTPVLTPNQAMDSLALQEVILANNQSGFQRNYFCRAVERGIVCVAIPEGFMNLTACCIDSMERGLKDKRSEFIVSGLKFLYENDDAGHEAHPYEERCEVLRYISEKLQQSNRTSFHGVLPSWLSADEKEIVEQYIESIILLNRSIIKYNDFVSHASLLTGIMVQICSDYIKKRRDDRELYEFLCEFLTECSAENAPIYRSYYYRFLEMSKARYSRRVIAEVKEIIDISYNRVMAISVGTGAELSISEDLNSLSETVIEAEGTQSATVPGYTVIDAADEEYLNWEMLVNIYDEIQAIMNEKGYNWQEAMDYYYIRERKLPFVLSGKYMALSGLKTIISSIVPGGGLFVDVITDELLEIIIGTIGTVIQLPGGLKETKERIKTANKAVKLLDTIVFTDDTKPKRGK